MSARGVLGNAYLIFGHKEMQYSAAPRNGRHAAVPGPGRGGGEGPAGRRLPVAPRPKKCIPGSADGNAFN